MKIFRNYMQMKVVTYGCSEGCVATNKKVGNRDLTPKTIYTPQSCPIYFSATNVSLGDMFGKRVGFH